MSITSQVVMPLRKFPTVYRVISKETSSDTRRNNEIKVVKNENHEPLNK